MPKREKRPTITVLDTWLSADQGHYKVLVEVDQDALRGVIHKALRNKTRRASVGPLRVQVGEIVPRRD